jgi:hypothetical protein
LTIAPGDSNAEYTAEITYDGVAPPQLGKLDGPLKRLDGESFYNLVSSMVLFPPVQGPVFSISRTDTFKVFLDAAHPERSYLRKKTASGAP